MSPLQEFAEVTVATDRFAAEGAPLGTLGYVLNDYGDGNYEVEVSDPDTGETVATFVAAESELRAI